MDLKQLKDLIAQKVEQARHSTLVHLTLSQALNALETGAHDEGQRLITEAEALDAELRNLLHLGPMPMKQTSTELVGELSKHFVTPSALDSFKRSLESHVTEWVDELSRRAEVTVGGLLQTHVAELERRFPAAATVLHEVAQQTITPELEPVTEPTNEAPAPAGPPWPPPIDGEFPTRAAFAALGFYPETYDHQLSEWEARKAAATAPVEPSTPAEETPARQTPAENAPSESATGASPETR